VNYDDLGGFQPGSDAFGGVQADLNLQLIGASTCRADLDGSGGVDTRDLVDLLTAWGSCTGCREDLDGDGDVDPDDLIALIAAWGPCPPWGACCFDDGDCALMDEIACVAAGGYYRGEDTRCVTDCTVGACCFDDGTCTEVIEEACAGMGGTYEGHGSTCATTCLGACCFDDGTCEEAMVESECVEAGGHYRGDGSRCPTDLFEIVLDTDTDGAPVIFEFVRETPGTLTEIQWDLQHEAFSPSWGSEVRIMLTHVPSGNMFSMGGGDDPSVDINFGWADSAGSFSSTGSVLAADIGLPDFDAAGLWEVKVDESFDDAGIDGHLTGTITFGTSTCPADVDGSGDVPGAGPVTLRATRP
jgi:hypothetical protein